MDERQEGTEFTLSDGKGRALTTVVPVIGRHMAANAGLAIVMLLEVGYTWEHVFSTLDGERIDASLPGRTQLVSGPEGPAVYVDFGHSPDAFEKTLAAVRRVTPGRSSCSSVPTATATPRSATTWGAPRSRAATSSS